MAVSIQELGQGTQWMKERDVGWVAAAGLQPCPFTAAANHLARGH